MAHTNLQLLLFHKLQHQLTGFLKDQIHIKYLITDIRKQDFRAEPCSFQEHQSSWEAFQVCWHTGHLGSSASYTQPSPGDTQHVKYLVGREKVRQLLIKDNHLIRKSRVQSKHPPTKKNHSRRTTLSCRKRPTILLISEIHISTVYILFINVLIQGSPN